MSRTLFAAPGRFVDHALRRALGCALAAILLGAVPAANAQPISGGVDLLEVHVGDGGDHLLMESAFSVGSGLKTITLKVDGGSDTRPTFEDLELQGLWMPQVSSAVTLAAGIRQDLRAGPNLTHAVAGIEAALLPWLSAEHYMFLSQRGNLTGSAKAVLRFPLGKRLTLEPRGEISWAARAISTEAIGSGATGMELSMRLRRSLGSHADLYVGVIHEALVGSTAAIARSNGDAVHVTRAVLGLGLKL